MRKLALRDEILLQIDKAARYIGGEVNAVMKNKEDVDIRFAMAFPDVYEIGMSNLGMMILYDMFNKRDDVWCERLFSPWTDLDKIMRCTGANGTGRLASDAYKTARIAAKFPESKN